MAILENIFRNVKGVGKTRKLEAIAEYIEQQEYIGIKKIPSEITLAKINRLKDLKRDNNIIRLKKILKLDTDDEEEILRKTDNQIAYLKYMRKLEIKGKEADKKEYKRIVENKIENVTNKHLDKRNNPPPAEVPRDRETYDFWNQQIGTPTEVDEQCKFLKEIMENQRVNEAPAEIRLSEVKEAIRLIPNWKAPGNDKIQGYWIKYAKTFYPLLTTIFQKWMDEPGSIPPEYLEGNTILVYKSGDSKDPANYRPITCMNVITKIFTSVMRMKIEAYMSTNNMKKQLTPNQLGLKRGSLGAKEGIILNKIIQDTQNNKDKIYYEIYYDIKNPQK